MKTSSTNRSAPKAPPLRKWIRRAHLYSGIVMFPWLLFFGVSGMLFNHPGVGERVTASRLSPQDLAAVGIKPWDPNAAAALVVDALNGAAAPSYELDDGLAPEFSGPALLSAPFAEGNRLVLLDMQRGAGVIASRYARPVQLAPFSGRRLPLAKLSVGQLSGSVETLATERQLQGSRPLTPHPSIAPELRFRLRDTRGQLFNATYSTATGELQGRPADSRAGLGLTSLMTRLHTTHHFTPKPSAQSLWALFQDLLGLTVVVWTTSGLFMWWQMKKARLAGALSLAGAVAVAFAIAYANIDHIYFGAIPQVLGPGG